MNLCLICNKKENDTSVHLTNKSFVHSNCEKALYEKVLILEKEISSSGFLRKLFSQKLKTTKKDLDKLKLKQKNIYDHWKTYPPDWSKRKEKLKSEKKACDKCGKIKFKKKDSLEVHHKIPIREGGSHIDSNLELLCKNCHKEEHLKKPYKFRKKKKSNS